MSRYNILVQAVVVAIAGVWVLTYWQKRDDGRHVYQHQQAAEQASDSLMVFDTRTGTVFAWATNRGITKVCGSE